MTATKTKTIDLGGRSVKITIERGTWVEEIRLDGQLCGTKTHPVDRTEIALYDGDKRLAYGSALRPLSERHPKFDEARKAGCVGVVGSQWFVKPDTAESIRAALAELEAENPKTAEQIAIEAQSAKAKAKAEAWLDSDEYKSMVELERRMDDPDSDL